MPKVRADDWTGGAYVRVFRTIRDDRPDIYGDDRALAWWLRLLLDADAAFPASASLRRDLPADIEERFVASEVIDRVGTDGYRFHGLTKLRSTGAMFAVVGGIARAQKAARDEAGRMLPSSPAGPAETQPYPAGWTEKNAGPSPLVQPAGYLNGATSETAGPADMDQPSAGLQRSSEQNNSDVVTTTPTTAELVSPAPAPAPAPARAPVREAPPETEPEPPKRPKDRTGWPPDECTEPEAHRPAHRRVPGLDVWRCPTCEDARRAGPSLKERVGWKAPDDAPF